ncbi:mannose-1-phosphate guanylyltransferase [soil metagenome]
MAGGSGERFWPLSRSNRPKQLLKLTSQTETLLEEAVNRILPLVSAENVFVSTSGPLREAIGAATTVLPAANVLAEPARRNTAGCLTWVAAELTARFPGEEIVVAVLTADHLIGHPDRFRAKVSDALDAAESQHALVTIGIRPTRPETGYGYIEVGAEQTGHPDALRAVERFREKPNLSQAEDFIADGHYFWNSGMFFWRISDYISEMQAASPVHADSIPAIVEALGARDAAAAQKAFEKLPDISIDYALMEKSRNVLMVEADFPWDDVGSWDALDRSRPQDKDGNVIEGAPVVIDTRSSIIVDESGGSIAVGVVGVEDLVIIVSKDAVLVVPKDKAQEVRHIARELKKRGNSQV